jgi:hypothetical protein
LDARFVTSDVRWPGYSRPRSSTKSSTPFSYGGIRRRWGRPTSRQPWSLGEYSTAFKGLREFSPVTADQHPRAQGLLGLLTNSYTKPTPPDFDGM